MQYKSYQECRTNLGWQPVEVPSSSGDGKYVVMVNPWGTSNENICSCKGYNFRGYCKHQSQAPRDLCMWSELDGVPQTDEQRQNNKCPECGELTIWQIEVLEQ